MEHSRLAPNAISILKRTAQPARPVLFNSGSAQAALGNPPALSARTIVPTTGSVILQAGIRMVHFAGGRRRAYGLQTRPSTVWRRKNGEFGIPKLCARTFRAQRVWPPPDVYAREPTSTEADAPPEGDTGEDVFRYPARIGQYAP